MAEGRAEHSVVCEREKFDFGCSKDIKSGSLANGLSKGVGQRNLAGVWQIACGTTLGGCADGVERNAKCGESTEG